jgi:choline dehydrogenase
VLPTFRAIEHDEQFATAPWHGDAGPVTITRLASGPVEDAFGAAALDAGFPACADHNAPGSLGIGPWPTNRVGGGRWGTLPAVAPLLRGRASVLGATNVRRVLHRNQQVTGVELVGVDGSVEELRADVVVVACGAFGTPELMARSGLRGNGVGADLQDHPWIALDVEADPDAIRTRPVSGALLRYGVGGDPDEEVQVFGFSASIYQPELAPSVYRMSVGVMAPSSRGVLHTDGTQTAIHLNHLGAEADTRRLADGVRRASELLDAMQVAGAVKVPADAWWQADDLEAELHFRVETYNHPVGTCGIGRVVDERLRVDAVRGLRIADASVMPVIPKANTNLASMMIGARAAQFVVEDDC